MHKKRKVILYSIGIFLILGQFIPIEKSNPKSENEIVEKEVRSILERSCYDCHSNKTQWPFYSNIFPLSFIISRHVAEGREELNFSDWESYSLKKKKTKSSEIVEEIESNEMPPVMYRLLHANSAIAIDELNILKKWSEKLEKEYASKD